MRDKNAVEAFDEILEIDPDNAGAKRNKEITIKELDQQFSHLLN